MYAITPSSQFVTAFSLTHCLSVTQRLRALNTIQMDYHILRPSSARRNTPCQYPLSKSIVDNHFLLDIILCTKANLKGFERSHKNSTISLPIRNEMMGFGKGGFSWHSPWIFQLSHKFTNPCFWPHTLGLNCAYLWPVYQVMRGSVPWISFLSSCPPKRLCEQHN